MELRKKVAIFDWEWGQYGTDVWPLEMDRKSPEHSTFEPLHSSRSLFYVMTIQWPIQRVHVQGVRSNSPP